MLRNMAESVRPALRVENLVKKYVMLSGIVRTLAMAPCGTR